MKRIILIITSLLVLAGCGYHYSDEQVVDKYIEVKEWYHKNKKYSENVYIIKTEKRAYRVEGYGNDLPDGIYYSYDIGDKVIFLSDKGRNGLKIVMNER